MKNICFVPCLGKGKLYRKIADYLIEHYSYSENSFFWIITDKRDLGIIKSDNFLLLRYLKKSCGEEIFDLRLNEIIASDRLLCKKKKDAKNYLINLESILNNFIQANSINFIIGERANAHELLLGRICTANLALKCHYISMSDIRIPAFHYAFFDDEKEINLIETDNATVSDIFNLEKPRYLMLNDNLNKISSYLKLSRIKRIISNMLSVSRYNVVGFRSLFQYFSMILRREINRLSYKLLKKSDLKDFIDTPYIFYGLHKQPESSIDVCGRYMENQYQNIYNLWRLLPRGWFLIVKEHTNAIGDRNYFFYRKVKQLPGVVLVKETTDSYTIIRNAKITFSVTGTISLEAALMGKIAVTLSKVFFNRLNNCFNYSFQELESIGLEKIASTNFDDNISLYKRYILKNAFSGSVLDCFADPDVLCCTNIKKLGDSLYKLLNKI